MVARTGLAPDADRRTPDEELVRSLASPPGCKKRHVERNRRLATAFHARVVESGEFFWIGLFACHARDGTSRSVVALERRHGGAGDDAETTLDEDPAWQALVAALRERVQLSLMYLARGKPLQRREDCAGAIRKRFGARRVRFVCQAWIPGPEDAQAVRDLDLDPATQRALEMWKRVERGVYTVDELAQRFENAVRSSGAFTWMGVVEGRKGEHVVSLDIYLTERPGATGVEEVADVFHELVLTMGGGLCLLHLVRPEDRDPRVLREEIRRICAGSDALDLTIDEAL